MFGPEVEKTAAFIQPLNSHHAEFFLFFFSGCHELCLYEMSVVLQTALFVFS